MSYSERTTQPDESGAPYGEFDNYQIGKQQQKQPQHYQNDQNQINRNKPFSYSINQNNPPSPPAQFYQNDYERESPIFTSQEDFRSNINNQLKHGLSDSQRRAPPPAPPRPAPRVQNQLPFYMEKHQKSSYYDKY